MQRALSTLLLFLCIGWESLAQVPASRIPIVAWYSIPHEVATVARYEELRAAGFTHSLTTGTFSAPLLRRGLDSAAPTGVKLIATCPELFTIPEPTIQEFRDHPALAAWFLADEPSTLAFDSLGALAQTINRFDSLHFPYINLLPAYASPQQWGAYTYNGYIRGFLHHIPSPVLSFDSYPVREGGLRVDWFENLEYISEEAIRSHRNFWGFVLAVPHFDFPVPTLPQLRLQAFSNLAYGAQGIQYFGYWTPGSLDHVYSHGPIGLDGKRTEVYDRVALVNREIAALSPHFAGAMLDSVFHTGSRIPPGTKPLRALPPQISSLETKGNGAVVSFLRNGSFRYCAIVARDHINPVTISLGTLPSVDRVLKDGSVVTTGVYTGKLELDPGDMILLRWRE